MFFYAFIETDKHRLCGCLVERRGHEVDPKGCAAYASKKGFKEYTNQKIARLTVLKIKLKKVCKMSVLRYNVAFC